MIKIICFIFTPFLFYAQTVNSFVHWQNEAAFSLVQQSILANNFTFLGGVFREEFISEQHTISSIGGRDVLLALVNENGQAIWTVGGGSERNDELVAVAHFEDRLYATGTYWLEGNFDDLQIETVGSPQGIFLLQYDLAGEAVWGISIDGSGDKEIYDLKVDQVGNILLTGSFQGELWINEDTLQADNSTFFIAKLDAQGQLIWTQQAQTRSGRASGIALSVLPNFHIAVLGEYVGETAFGEVRLMTDTEDEDIFLATYDASGNLLWVREAGGVFPSFAVAIAQINNQLVVTGNFVGRIEVNNELIIQSTGVNEDIFLLSYNFNGEPLWARTIGSTAVENVQTLASNGKHLLLGGFFRNDFRSGIVSLSGLSDQETAFVLQTDDLGTAEWGQVVASDERSYINKAAWRSDELWQVVGDFQGSLKLSEDIDVEAVTLNGFIATFKNQTTLTKNYGKNTVLFPFRQTANLLTLEAPILADWVLYDLQGKVIHAAQKAQYINIHLLPIGIYVVRICANGNCETSSFFKPE